MTTIPVKNPRVVVPEDFSTEERRKQIVEDARQQVRSEERTFVRRLMERRHDR